MVMSELSFDDYAYHAWTTAFFLEQEDAADRFHTVFYGYNEEVDELLADDRFPQELTAQLWGHDVEPGIAAQLSHSLTAEAGDILYYITAAGLLRNIPLRELMHEGLGRYTGENPALADETFQEFDERLHGRMAAPVPTGYRPSYSTWKLWDLAPFVDTMHIVLAEPAYAKGPLTLIGDGRYALDRLHSTFGRLMLPELGSDEEFLASAGLALGSLSVVLQHRFDSSLTAAAENNIAKRERREQSGTLRSGTDIERSRRPHTSS